MKFIDEVSDDKLRGGFYTPPSLVHECYARLAAIVGSRPIHILEPSAGDGAFLRAIPEGVARYRLSASEFTCVEFMPEEARKCKETLRSLGMRGSVRQQSFFAWARDQSANYDAVVGNPPFVRYQFVPAEQRADAECIFAGKGKEIDGVANLWIPFVLISTELLREGGAFSLVLPGELLATKSAGLVRSELVRHFDNLRIDLYQRGHFPHLLQDVIVVSGERTAKAKSARRVEFVEHGAASERRWPHVIRDSKESWTRYLLSEKELGAYRAAIALEEMRRLGEVASLGVSIVTGANDFFTVDDGTMHKHQLQPWARPLLARTSDCPGLQFLRSDLRMARRAGKKTWILDFSPSATDPLQFAGAREYLRLGEQRRLPGRYKCRIRVPWYRVPDVRPGELMMSKRAHQFHRLLLNKAGAHTTDTIYRGHMRPIFEPWRESLVAAFHNSLTILSSEIEGRTYGGGVLELVPSEIARLVVPMVDMGKHLPMLDKICRGAGGQLDAGDTLIDATDRLVVRQLPRLGEFMRDLTQARHNLRRRRLHK